jgi:hypothetical protein
MLPAAQAVFQNQLVKWLREIVPAMDPFIVLSAGANSNALASLPQENIAGIIESYSKALRSTFAIGIPFAGIALFVSFFMPWFKYADASKKVDAKKAETLSGKGDASSEVKTE